MKNFYFLCSLLVIFFLSSCQRFDPPEIKLQMTNQKDSLYNFYAMIIDGGGVYFNSKGYVYSLNRNPMHTDVESFSFDVKSNEEEWFFDWSMSAKDFPVPDTIYYICGWVKTNAGIGYSNPMRIDRRLPYDDADTLK